MASVFPSQHAVSFFREICLFQVTAAAGTPYTLYYLWKICMNTLFSAVMSLGPMALLIALVSVPVYYLAYRNAPEPKQRRTLRHYLLGVSAAGILAYGVGAAAGIAVACFAAKAGNLCGLVGIFGLGPLFSAAAIVIYAHLWIKSAREPG